LDDIGRVLMVVGGLLLALGFVLTQTDRIPLVGRLPGDITLRGDGWAVYAPLATSIVLSIVLTLAITLVSWLSRR
jgi:ABC-type Co2+ transport system permease subunit